LSLPIPSDGREAVSTHHFEHHGATVIGFVGLSLQAHPALTIFSTSEGTLPTTPRSEGYPVPLPRRRCACPKRAAAPALPEGGVGRPRDGPPVRQGSWSCLGRAQEFETCTLRDPTTRRPPGEQPPAAFSFRQRRIRCRRSSIRSQSTPDRTRLPGPALRSSTAPTQSPSKALAIVLSCMNEVPS
jgi:hypothetical protein